MTANEKHAPAAGMAAFKVAEVTRDEMQVARRAGRFHAFVQDVSLRLEQTNGRTALRYDFADDLESKRAYTAIKSFFKDRPQFVDVAKSGASVFVARGAGYK